MSEDRKPREEDGAPGSRTGGSQPRFVNVEDFRPEGYDGPCLRPTGLCDLGGCCDICWYRPDHPRFSES